MTSALGPAWFRIAAEIDIHNWSDDPDWQNYITPGKRRLATNHLMGKGYWIWIIPLVSGHSSMGIVADPRYHSFETFNTYERALQWLEKHEPVARDILKQYGEKPADFRVMKDFAYDCKRLYDAAGWGLTGEAGAFMDPFYSPGTDFIALGNSWLTELIVQDFRGEDVNRRAMIYEYTHRELLNGWIMLYRDMYSLFGNTRVMLMKIIWDWATYWGVPAVMFMNKGYTELEILKRYVAGKKSPGQRFARLNEQMQQFFREWGDREQGSYSDFRLNVFDLECIYTLHRGLAKRYDAPGLIRKVESNLAVLEDLAAEIFRRASAKVHGTPADMGLTRTI
jgi:hypothetical protein